VPTLQGIRSTGACNEADLAEPAQPVFQESDIGDLFSISGLTGITKTLSSSELQGRACQLSDLKVCPDDAMSSTVNTTCGQTSTMHHHKLITSACIAETATGWHTQGNLQEAASAALEDIQAPLLFAIKLVVHVLTSTKNRLRNESSHSSLCAAGLCNLLAWSIADTVLAQVDELHY
jgi:hypothetical protein